MNRIMTMELSEITVIKEDTKPIPPIRLKTPTSVVAPKLIQTIIPIVQVMELCDDPIDMMVGFSHGDATAEAMEHLISQGHRRVGFVGREWILGHCLEWLHTDPWWKNTGSLIRLYIALR